MENSDQAATKRIFYHSVFRILLLNFLCCVLPLLVIRLSYQILPYESLGSFLNLFIFLCFCTSIVFISSIVFRQHRSIVDSLEPVNSMAELGCSAYQIAHDLRTPIVALKSVVDGLNSDSIALLRSEDRVKLLKICSKRLHDMADSILSTQKERIGSKKELDIHSIVEDLAFEFELQFKRKEISFQTELQAKSTNIKGDASAITRSFSNLIQNAVEAVKTNGKIRLQTRSTEQVFILNLFDDGPGLSPEKINQIKRGCANSTKGHALGVGLLVVKRVVDAHGGILNVFSEKGRGACFQIKFPLASAAQLTNSKLWRPLRTRIR